MPTEGDVSTGCNEIVTFGDLPNWSVFTKLYFLPRTRCETALTVSSQLSFVESGIVVLMVMVVVQIVLSQEMSVLSV